MANPAAFAPKPDQPDDADSASDLWPLAERFGDIDAVVGELTRLSAVLELPARAVHVISDVHGEDKKLRHVINNASGTLRPLIQRVLGNRLAGKELDEFITLSFYPAEMVEQLERTLTEPEARSRFVIRTLKSQLMLVRELSARYSFRRAARDFPPAYEELLLELLRQPADAAPNSTADACFTAAVCNLARHGRDLHLVHLCGRLVRNLAIDELIIAGDCWDRGPRGDRVVDYLRQQPNVSFVWGNHDAAWIGAALGHDALICNVLRVSLRYRRLSQLDQGYSIPLTALEHLARSTYGNDPAKFFMPKSPGIRPMELVARMQKAIAIMQLKLEGQAIARHPEWGMENRRLLHQINLAAGTVVVDSKTYALRDRLFPTLNSVDPYALTPAEQACINQLKESFLASQKLSEHIRYLIRRGAMSLQRDQHLIFHGCVPCDGAGQFLTMPLDGRQVAGRAMFDATERAVTRAVETRMPSDLDFLWYLWAGPRSPLFGKDRIATFERDFIADKASHHEEKDPYFKLIHEPWFCEKVLAEFGLDPHVGLIVNGHVPVKVEDGENPLKRSGKAITIDGAFSEAYGDRGYTLVIEPDRTLLAEHHHFDSIDSAMRDGVDIVPQVQTIRQNPTPRTIGDSSRGVFIRAKITQLHRLADAYRTGILRPVHAGLR